MEPQAITAAVNDELTCKNCGAVLHFVPGTKQLKCEYCGETNTIEHAEEHEITSVDLDDFIAQLNKTNQVTGLQAVSCKGCGSQTVFKENITADKCPFCASPLVIELDTRTSIQRPHYVLPFIVDRKAAAQYFQQWLKGLWFAPNDLSKMVNSNSSSPLQGVYMPYWTYNSDTVTDYTGERGVHYYVTETYTETVNGRSETRTRQVRRTRWNYASGTVSRKFHNLTVPSSRSLPQKTMLDLGPWNFAKLEPFDERYLSGFRSETYQVNPNDGFEIACKLMEPDIERSIRNDIGGDEQRINSKQTRYHNNRIKYVLLPVWISSYKYNSKIYQFTVNACTGEVIGQRPYSWIKITLAILAGIILVVLALMFFGSQQ